MDKTSSCAIWQHNGDCWAKHLITQKLHQKGVLMRRYYFPVGALSTKCKQQPNYTTITKLACFYLVCYC
jgi:hypothetical protein